MKVSRLQLVVALGLLVLVGLGAAGFFLTHEQVEKEVRVPPSGEARKNPYLGLERTLTDLAVETYSVRQLSDPNEADELVDVILLVDAERDFSPEQVEAWRSWVAAGNHLVLSAPMATDEAGAPLLYALGFAHDPDAEQPEGAAKARSKTYDIASTTPPLGWSAPGVDWRARDDGDGVFAVSRRVDSGRVTLVSDLSVADNDSLGEASHAQLLWDIVMMTPSGEYMPIATIVLFGERKSWIAYVFRATWPFFVVLAVVLFFALQHGRRRFGPLVPDPPDERRSRLDHIDATGRFLWEQGATACLVEAAQQAFIDALARRRPRVSDMSNAERAEIAAEELDIPLQEARDLLRKPSGSRGTERFTRRIKQLEHYRRQL